MGHYLDASAGSSDLALSLHDWNLMAGASLFRDIGYLEIGMRNSCDSQMRSLWAERGWEGDWLEDSPSVIGRHSDECAKCALGQTCNGHQFPYREILEARSRAKKRLKSQSASADQPVTRDQIVAQLPLGVWATLVSKRFVNFWPKLGNAFPFKPNRSQEVVSVPLSKIRSLRNGIAHHHRIFHLDLHQEYRDILDVASYVDPSLKRWISENSTTPTVLARNPIPRATP